MEQYSETKQESLHSNNRLQVRAVFVPDRRAMLAALRVVLDLPAKPTVLRETL